ncbi:MAG: tRNA pseudouridine(38-40) synthase TruA [Bacteroidia bacterium]
MNKYVAHIAYDGSSYRGWQKQINVVGVQQVFEQALSKVLNTTTSVLGCGRTDAQVHASQFFVQFKHANTLDESFVFIMNKVLPLGIKVYDVNLAEPNFNVQHNALARTYHYYFHLKQNPFINKYSSFYQYSALNMGKMQEALSLFKGYYDFYSFCKTPDRHPHTMVDISNAFIKSNRNQTMYCIKIKGDRFLKGMVRAIAYHVIEAGRGKMPITEINKKLQMAASYPNIQLAYPQGLYLAKVEYSEFDFDNHAEPVAALLND